MPLQESPRGTRSSLCTRLKPDGSLDPAFGAAGKVFTGIPGGDAAAYDVVTDSLGRIVVGGSWRGNHAGPDYIVLRYGNSGELDETFGSRGVTTTNMGLRDRLPDPFGSGYDFGFGLAIDSQGRILAAGPSDWTRKGGSDFGIARYTTDGILDNTFGANATGKVATDFGTDDEAAAVVIQPSGGILAAGTAGGRFALARYTAAGILDTTYGIGGTVTSQVGAGTASVSDMVLDPLGRTVVVGGAKAVTGGYDDFALARYDPLRDHGDAPPSYDWTLSVHAAVNHDLGGPILGAGADAEPEPRAVDRYDDGVKVRVLNRGGTGVLDVTVDRARLAYLDAWIDFNGDGKFDGPGEQIFGSLGVTTGFHRLMFPVPSHAELGGTWARFRVSQQINLGATGYGGPGEVEDYRVFVDALSLDLGDAPERYATYLRDSGPYHELNGPVLGDKIDHELDGAPSDDAGGDNRNKAADEDEVRLVSWSGPKPNDGTVRVVLSNAPDAFLDGWIDFNHDGKFEHPDEWIFTSVKLVKGVQELKFDTRQLPAPGAGTSYVVRFRVSYAGDQAPTGYGGPGEVEDYRWGAEFFVGDGGDDQAADAGQDVTALIASASLITGTYKDLDCPGTVAAPDPLLGEGCTSNIAAGRNGDGRQETVLGFRREGKGMDGVLTDELLGDILAGWDSLDRDSAAA